MSVPLGDRARRRWSIGLAILGATVALLGGVLLYAREELFDRDALASRAQSALSEQRVASRSPSRSPTRSLTAGRRPWSTRGR